MPLTISWISGWCGVVVNEQLLDEVLDAITNMIISEQSVLKGAARG